MIRHQFVVTPQKMGFQGNLLLGVVFLTKLGVELSWPERLVKTKGIEFELEPEGNFHGDISYSTEELDSNPAKAGERRTNSLFCSHTIR